MKNENYLKETTYLNLVQKLPKLEAKFETKNEHFVGIAQTLS